MRLGRRRHGDLELPELGRAAGPRRGDALDAAEAH